MVRRSGNDHCLAGERKRRFAFSLYQSESSGRGERGPGYTCRAERHSISAIGMGGICVDVVWMTPLARSGHSYFLR